MQLVKSRWKQTGGTTGMAKVENWGKHWDAKVENWGKHWDANVESRWEQLEWQKRMQVII